MACVNYHYTRHALMVAGSGIAIICSSASASAQDAAPTAPEVVEDDAPDPAVRATNEIVVTAQFREQRLQDTPIAITAMDAEMLDARSQTGLTDVAATAPNVTIRESVTAYGATAALSIRGVGQFDNNFAYEPGVGLYVDDVYYPTVYGSQLDLLDLDRVEILRGPQGTLAGKNSIGGAVKLYSRRAEGTGEGFVEASYGSFNRLDFRASVDIPLIEDVMALRLAGVYKTRDGYVDRIDYGCKYPDSGVPTQPRSGGTCKLGTLGGQDFKGMRGSLSITPTDDLEVDIIADFTRDDSELAATVISAVNNNAPGPAAAGVDLTQFLNDRRENYSTFADPDRNVVLGPENYFQGWGVSGQLRYRISDQFSLTSITAYRSYDSGYALDLDGTPYPLATQFVAPSFDSFTQEVRLNGAALDDMVNFTVGGFYFDAEGKYGALIDFLAPPNNFYLGDDVIPSDSISGFTHVEVRPVDNLTISGGIRYTDESKEFTFGRESLLDLPFALGEIDGQTYDYQASRWDYRISLDYRWSDAILTYATFSTGFKGGGINPRPFFVEQVVPFNPETLKAYEIGAKLDLFNRDLRLNLSGFINQYDQIQLILNQSFRDTFPASVPINAGEAEMKGLEAELSATPIAGLLIDASASYLDFEYTTLTEEAQASGIGYDGAAPFTSDWKLSGGIQYEIDSGTAGVFTPRLDYAYQSEFWSNAANRSTNRTPGYGLANARLTWDHPDNALRLALAVTNLFDKDYQSVNYDNLYTLSGAAQATLGRPREWSLTAKYEF